MDCTTATVQGCDGQCQFVPLCTSILQDPAVIHMDDTRAAGVGRLRFHGRMIPSTSVSPLDEGFMVLMSNANGEIYRAEVAPGELLMNGSGRFFLNGTTSATAANNGGMSSLHIRRRKDGGQTGYGFRLRAVGDFSRATVALMTTQVYFGNDVAYLTASWRERPGRWTLAQRNYED